MSRRAHYILLNKPYGVLSQFTPAGGWKSLRDLGPFPPGVYAAGRLDADSEGLLLLTDDNVVKHRLTSPAYAHPRTYLVQVERRPDEEALQRLREGVHLEGRMTRPAEIHIPDPQPQVPARTVPVRSRKTVPTVWIEMTLREGRNRQVRRMTAAVGHPAVRLIRTALGGLAIEGMEPGAHRDLTPEERRWLLSSIREDQKATPQGDHSRIRRKGRSR